MTTPDPARTAEQAGREAYQQWLAVRALIETRKDAFRNFDSWPDFQRAVRAACLPEPRTPQASPASDQAPHPRLHGWWAVFVTDSLAPHQPIALFQYRDHAERWGNDNYRNRNRVEEFCTRDATPPPSTGDKPQCPHCGNNVQVVPRGPHLSDEDGDGTRWFGKQWFCNGCCSWFSAPTPPHATGDILDRAVAWVEEKYPTRGHATGELLRECIAEISTLRHAARVTPPQQEDDRSWEKDCEVRANGVVSYPSITSSTGSVYLVPDGRWLTYDQWLLLTPPSDRFPTESAARAALAKAPRPTP